MALQRESRDAKYTVARGLCNGSTIEPGGTGNTHLATGTPHDQLEGRKSCGLYTSCTKVGRKGDEGVQLESR